MKIYQIVAFAENMAIGRDGTIPWCLKEDLKRFRELTLGKPLIMGRATAESLGKALPKRLNLVLSSNPDWTPPEGMIKCSSFEEALTHCVGFFEVYVIGGARVYAEAAPFTDMIRATIVHTTVEDADTFYPFDPEKEGWEIIYTEPFDTHSFVDYVRKEAE